MAEVITAKLALEGVTSGYGNVDIINDLSLDVRPGEIFALMGKNGMGKTTLLKTIVGLRPARRGQILLDGAEVTPRDVDALGKAAELLKMNREIMAKALTLRTMKTRSSTYSVRQQ